MGVTISGSHESLQTPAEADHGSLVQERWRPGNRRTQCAVSPAGTKESAFRSSECDGEVARRATGISRPANIREGHLFTRRVGRRSNSVSGRGPANERRPFLRKRRLFFLFSFFHRDSPGPVGTRVGRILRRNYDSKVPDMYAAQNSDDPSMTNSPGGVDFNPAHWVPLRVPLATVFDPTNPQNPIVDHNDPNSFQVQGYLTPHWGGVRSFALDDSGLTKTKGYALLCSRNPIRDS